MPSLNQHRASRCERALKRYESDDTLIGCLVDFLSDARHWCDRNGANYAALDRKAYDHYCQEAVADDKEGS